MFWLLLGLWIFLGELAFFVAIKFEDGEYTELSVCELVKYLIFCAIIGPITILIGVIAYFEDHSLKICDKIIRIKTFHKSVE